MISSQYCFRLRRANRFILYREKAIVRTLGNGSHDRYGMRVREPVYNVGFGHQDSEAFLKLTCTGVIVLGYYDDFSVCCTSARGAKNQAHYFFVELF